MRGCMLINSRGGPPFWDCALMNSRGGPLIFRGGPPLGTISMDLAVCKVAFFQFFGNYENHNITPCCALSSIPRFSSRTFITPREKKWHFLGSSQMHFHPISQCKCVFAISFGQFWIEKTILLSNEQIFKPKIFLEHVPFLEK